MTQRWRPLTQKELPDLSSGDTLTLRQNYLDNPDRLPVTYVSALCVEKRKRDGTFLLEGSVTPISVSLTEAGRYVETGWYMTGEELSKLKLRDSVIIHKASGERSAQSFLTSNSTSPSTLRTFQKNCVKKGDGNSIPPG
jgi:hypothetical protein